MAPLTPTQANIRFYAALIASAVVVIVLLVVGWQLLDHLGTPPSYKPDGTTVSYDRYDRTKDIFVLIVPLFTTIIGFLIGSQGTAKAQDTAKQAVAAANDAQNKVTAVGREKEALLATSKVLPAGTDLLSAAQDLHPSAFGLPDPRGSR